MECIFDGCERSITARGYCNAHYAQLSRGKELKPLRGYLVYKQCKVKSCEQQHSARGYCKKHWKIFTRYNTDPEVYEQKLLKQNGVCAICKTECKSGVSLSIDHDHSCCPEKGSSCGKCTRGLLCYTCNMGVGFFQDDIGLLSSAIQYLKKH